LDCDVAVDVFMRARLASRTTKFPKFLLSAVTDNHVQQYGEVNQLGGVFVNVSVKRNCRSLEISSFHGF
jgi:hypothetical protein